MQATVAPPAASPWELLERWHIEDGIADDVGIDRRVEDERDEVVHVRGAAQPSAAGGDALTLDWLTESWRRFDPARVAHVRVSDETRADRARVFGAADACAEALDPTDDAKRPARSRRAASSRVVPDEPVVLEVATTASQEVSRNDDAPARKRAASPRRRSLFALTTARAVRRAAARARALARVAAQPPAGPRGAPAAAAAARVAARCARDAGLALARRVEDAAARCRGESRDVGVGGSSDASRTGRFVGGAQRIGERRSARGVGRRAERIHRDERRSRMRRIVLDESFRRRVRSRGWVRRRCAGRGEGIHTGRVFDATIRSGSSASSPVGRVPSHSRPVYSFAAASFLVSS